MLRVVCSSCGGKVRGGDDWSGRSGSCPKCGAVIIFPQLESEFDRAAIAAEQAPASFGKKIADVVEFPNLGKLKTVAVIAAAGFSLWIWSNAIVWLAFGKYAYFYGGLRVIHLSRGSIDLNDGAHLDLFWATIFYSGYFGLWYLLMDGADEAIGRTDQKLLVWCLILIAGFAGWYKVITAQFTLAQQTRRVGYYPTSHASATSVLALIPVAALVIWRGKRSMQRRAAMQP